MLVSSTEWVGYCNYCGKWRALKHTSFDGRNCFFCGGKLSEKPPITKNYKWRD